jgi:hypothetical protein
MLLFRLDEDGLKKSLISKNKTSKAVVSNHNSNLNGVLEKFFSLGVLNFEPELQTKYPDIRAYAGRLLQIQNFT